MSTAEMRERIRAIPSLRRTTMRSLAAALKVSKSVILRLIRQGVIRRHTNNIKPVLTDANRLARVVFVLGFLVVKSDGTSAFSDMYDAVHIDEKWFNEDTDKKQYYLVEGEEEPVRRRQSKRYIDKTMFISAVARPRYNPHRKREFDGKIGIWAFAEPYEAQRSSKLREKGTVVLRNAETVDREAYKAVLIYNIIPAIKAKWPASGKKHTIWIQQDNAKPHVPVNDPDVIAAGTSGGWDIRMRCQPANSPDLNVLDLGYFRSIQSLQDFGTAILSDYFNSGVLPEE